MPETLDYQSAGDSEIKRRNSRLFSIIVVGAILLILALAFGPAVILGP
jgi:K+-transporting ATPase A subunit